MNFRILRYFILVAWVFLTFGACQRPTPIILHPTPTKLSKEEIIQLLRANSQKISSLKSGFNARLEYPQAGKSKKHSFEGALLYRKEKQSLRLQSFGTLGNTIFEILYKPHEVSLYIPSSEVVYSGDPDSSLFNSESPIIFSFLQEIVNGLEGEYDWEHVEYNDYSLRMQNGEFNYFFNINRNSLLLEKKTIAHNGVVIAEFFYQDYRKIFEKILPTKITAFFPPKKTTLTLYLDSPVINEALADNFFILSLPPNIRWLPLSKLNDFFMADLS